MQIICVFCLFVFGSYRVMFMAYYLLYTKRSFLVELKAYAIPGIIMAYVISALYKESVLLSGESL